MEKNLLIIKYDKNVFFVAGNTYENKDAIKSCGFKWNPQDKKWVTTDLKVISKFVQSGLQVVVTTEAKNQIQLKEEKNKEIVEKSSAVDSQINIPAPAGLQYMPFQKAGIDFVNTQKNVLIADEMGLGKTIQAIGYINLNENIKTVLVICPASLKMNWKQELEKWLVRPFNIVILNGKLADITITNYESVKKYFDLLRSRTWDLLILDESHYIKNYKAQRTKYITGFTKTIDKKKVFVNGIKDYTRQKILLTGTPILNRPDEIFTQLKVLGNELGRNPFAFRARYLVTDNYGNPLEGKNLEELQKKLRSTCMIRREKKDVLLDLPDKIRQVITLPSDILTNEQLNETNHLIDYLAENWDVATGRIVSNTPEFEEIAKVRHEQAIAKIPYVLTHLENVLEDEDKVVVFAHHHDVLNAIYEKFKDVAVLATGEQTLKERNDAVNTFQNNPNVKLFIGSTMAMGVGITLTSASTIIFAELEWRPGDLSQAEDRLHRIGQKSTVLVQYLVIDKSIDGFMIHKIIGKMGTIEKVTNINNISNDDFDITKFVKEFKEQNEISETTPEILRDYVSDNKSEPVLQALRILANNDQDFARENNGVGFNSMDSNFGHILAKMDRLTTKQYEIARKIIKKYHKQIPDDLFTKIYKDEVNILR